MLLITLFAPLIFLSAQVQNLETNRAVNTYQIDLIKDQLTLVSKQTLPQSGENPIAIDAHFQNNELIIDYHFINPSKQGYYVVNLDLRMDNESVQPSQGYLFGDLGKINTPVVGGKQIIWTNFIQDIPKAIGELELIISIESWGLQYLAYGVDCGEYPTFGFKQKIPFYAGFAVGVGSLVSGVVFKNEAEGHLEQHKLSNVLSIKEKEYQSYTDELRKAEIVTYIGIGIIAADALLYFLRKEKHRKRIRVFEEYCEKASLSVQPFLELPTAQTPQQAGLHFSYQF